MHGTLTTEDFIIMAADAGAVGRVLHEGNNVRMSLHFDNDAEIDAAFARLSEAGTIVGPLANMPWGGKYGSLTDHFGSKWMFNFQRPTGE